MKLTVDEERELISRWPDSRDELILGSAWLASWLARLYSGKGVNREDLVSAATFGLVVAADKFDPSFGNLFRTYAVHWARKYICDEFKHPKHEELPDEIFERLPLNDRELDVDKIAGLCMRTREMLKLRVNGMKLKDIGAEFGVSRERVRQLLAKAAKRITA